MTESIPEIPGFRVIREIGAGSRGRVYEASDDVRTVALKVFHQDALTDDGVLGRFLKSSPDRIRHASLITVEASGHTADGRLYIVMPLMVGDPLQVLLDDLKNGSSQRPSLSPLSIGPAGEVHPELPWCAAELFTTAADGLARAHAEGITHGRLHPSNLHLSPAGRLIVSGFGAAEPVNRKETANLRFRAPEQLDPARGACGPAADAYALGAILYEVLSRTDVFQETGSRELVRAILRSPVRPPRTIRPEIPEELEACVLKALEKDPSRRYAGAGEFAGDLRRFLQRETPEALAERRAGAPAPQAREGRRAAPRRRAMILRRVAAALVLGAALVAAVLAGNEVRRRSRTRGEARTVASLVQQGSYERALRETKRIRSLDPGSDSSVLLAEYASTAGALDALQRAFDASTSSSGTSFPPDTAQAVTEASRFRPADTELEALATRVVDLSRRDPLARQIEDPSPLVRCAALERLAREIRSGARPRDDARLAIQALSPGRDEANRLAIRALGLLGDSCALIDALHLAAGGPRVKMDSATFRLVWDVLARQLDEPAAALLCAWDLDACTQLDTAPRPAEVLLPPNINVHLEAGAGGGFRARWIRVRTCIEPEAVISSAARLAADRDLGPVLAGALEEAASPQALAALEVLARNNYLTVGAPALEALARLGDYPALNGILESDLPLPYREFALELSAEHFGPLCLGELSTLARRSPDPSLRRRAFRNLCRQDSSAAAAALPAALVDPALRQMALEELLCLPHRLSGPLSLRLLAHADGVVRSHAAAVLASLNQGGESGEIARLLLTNRLQEREAALALLTWKDGLSSYRMVLDILMSQWE